MASNTPAANLNLRMLRGAAAVHGAGAHMPSGREGNPLRGTATRSDDVQDIPFAPFGLIGIAPSWKETADLNAQRHQAASDAQQAKVQSGVDAYQQALEKTGDPRSALAQVFHPDQEGHVHFSDPQTFGAIMQMHQAMSQGQQGQGQFQSVDLGNGLVGVADPNGKYSVHTAKQGGGASHMIAGQRVNDQGQTVQTLINKDTGTSRDVQPEEGGAAVRKQPGPPKGLAPQERTELNDLDTVMQQLGTLQQTTGATGLLTGHLQRFTAQHTELSPTQAAAYNRAYDQMAPALLRLERVPGQSKLVAQQALQMLPHPGQADAYNLAQVIPGLQQQMRQHIANTYDSFHAEGKDTSVAQKLAMSYDAGPNYMARLRDAHQMLQSNAGNLNETQMRDLEDEQLHDRLTYDQSVRVTRQRIARGMMDPAEFDKAVAAHPDLAQISDSERTAPQYIRQWQAPMAPMPNAAQPGQAPIASPGAPPGRPMYPHGTGQPQSDQRTDPMAAKLAGQSTPQAQLPAQIQEPQLQQALPAANAMPGAAPTAQAQPAANPLAPDQAEMQRQQQAQQLLQQTQQLLQQTGMPGNPNMPTD